MGRLVEGTLFGEYSFIPKNFDRSYIVGWGLCFWIGGQYLTAR